MKIFLSWSGETSRQVALALRDFLPLVANVFEPWMSQEDIAKGSRWTQELSAKLDTTDAGILCLTRSNLSAEWLLFEAGALAKTANALVCPYLFRLRPSEVKGPLTLLQAVTSAEDKEENRKLVRTLYARVKDGRLTDALLDKAFDQWWDTDLSKRLANIAEPPESAVPARSTEDMLEEMLTILRGMASRSAVAESARAFIHGLNLPTGALVTPTIQLEQLNRQFQRILNDVYGVDAEDTDAKREGYRRALRLLAEERPDKPPDKKED